MKAEEKEKQILEQTGKGQGSDDLSVEEEAAIFNPKPLKVKIKDRTYDIMPMTLGQLEVMFRLSKIDMSHLVSGGPGVIDQVVEGIAEILEEPDKAFIKKNLRIPVVQEIMLKVRRQTYAGIPTPKGAPKGQ